MSDLTRKYHEARKAREHAEDDDPRSPNEERALEVWKREAEEAGATLDPDYAEGGGLPTSFVLGVMRRDKYTCKIHGDQGGPLDENGGLQVHHKSGIVESEWASKKGHSLERNNVVTLCARAHDELHDRAREHGTDSSQVLPEADEGTRHDHGQPEYDGSGWKPSDG